MNDQHLNLLVNRILSGFLKYKFGDDVYLVGPIDIKRKYLIDEIHAELMQEGDKIGLLTMDQSIQYLIDQGLWSLQRNAQLEVLIKDVEKFKIELFENRFKSRDAGRIRKKIKLFDDRIMKLMDEKFALYYTTSDGFASVLKTYYTVGYSLYYMDGSLVWNDDSFLYRSNHILETAVDYYIHHRLSDDQYRFIAKSGKWKQIWNSSKLALFAANSSNWTEEQNRLVSWSQIYDNIYSHPEPPEDDVIEDDYMLDGWMLIQHKKNSTSAMTPDNISSNPKIQNAEEVYIVAQTQQDAQNVNKLNDFRAIQVKKQRQAMLNQQGKVNESNLPDRAFERQLTKNKMMIEKSRKK